MEIARLSAYLLAGDPTWVELSVGSYYDLVSSIVVSYDEQATSWNGTDLPVQECVDRLRPIDPDDKLIFLPGSYFKPGRAPLMSETVQRTEALAVAETMGDWVLQLDGDEVVADPQTFFSCLDQAHSEGYDALEFPSRQLYQHLRGPWYLERSSRAWRVAADYPGPLAVRRGTVLTHCRQAHDARLFRVDVASRNTDPSHPHDAVVHRRVAPRSAVLHFSWVRGAAEFRRKVASWGHAQDRDWTAVVAAWEASRRSPWRAVLPTPVRTRGPGRQLRLARIPAAPGLAERKRNGLAS